MMMVVAEGEVSGACYRLKPATGQACSGEVLGTVGSLASCRLNQTLQLQDPLAYVRDPSLEGSQFLQCGNLSCYDTKTAPGQDGSTAN